jgi:hypothetical protein
MKPLRILLGLVFAALTVYTMFYAPEGMVLATLAIGAMHNENTALYRKKTGKKIKLVAWDKPIWTPLMGIQGGRESMFDESKILNRTVGLKPSATGMPIEVLPDFKFGGGEMEIGVFYPLTGLGKSGAETLKGTGEKAKFALTKVPINQKRHAFLEQDSSMSKQVWIDKQIVEQLYNRSEAYLSDWWGRYIGVQIYLAALQGYSENIVSPTGGIGRQKQSAMNLYTAGAGRATFSTTHATYEAEVASHLNGLGDDDVFNTEFINNLAVSAAMEHHVNPVMFEGLELLPLICHPYAYRQLQADTVYQDRHKNAGPRDYKANKLFTGKATEVYENCLIFQDKTIPSARITGDADYSDARSTTADSTGVCYGTEDANGNPDFMENPLDAGALRPCFILGQSSILCGVADNISFDKEEDDFGERVEIGTSLKFGVAAADIYDTDGQMANTAGNKRYENRSLVVGFTKSPNTISW